MASEPLNTNSDSKIEERKASRGRRLPRCSARPVADVTAAARPAGVAHRIVRCESSASSWLRDLRDASYAAWNRSWHQSQGIQAPTSKTIAAKLPADGVCLAARHALSLTSRPRRGWLALPVELCAAERVRVLASVTCVTLHTPHGVAHGIRAAEYKHRFPNRQPRNFVQTAFASLLGTPCCSRDRRGAAGWRCPSDRALPKACEFLPP